MLNPFRGFFSRDKTPAPSPAAARAPRGIDPRSPEGQLASKFLCDPGLFSPLSSKEAQLATPYFVVQRYRKDAIVLQEGDTALTHYLLLVLDGEVTAESLAPGATRSVTLTLLGPGSVLGEMSFLDGQARSATCRAETELLCATLSHEALLLMMEQAPQVAAKLMMLVALRMAQRLRNHSLRIKRYVQLIETMQSQDAENKAPELFLSKIRH